MYKNILFLFHLLSHFLFLVLYCSIFLYIILLFASLLLLQFPFASFLMCSLSFFPRVLERERERGRQAQSAFKWRIQDFKHGKRACKFHLFHRNMLNAQEVFSILKLDKTSWTIRLFLFLCSVGRLNVLYFRSFC